MPETSIRYLTMLRMIPRYPRTITAPQLSTALADHGFALTIRSVQRDLEKLSAHFPLIVDEDSRPYAWSFNTSAAQSMIPALDMPAALTLELARAYLTPVLPPRALEHLEPHFREAQETLGRPDNPLGRWPARVRVINRGLMTHRPEVASDVLETVTEALLKNYQCELVYQARSWPQPERIRVHPYGLIFRDPNVYLVGTIEGRQGTRQLALHRATEGLLVEKAVNRPEDFDLDKYIHSGAMAQPFHNTPIQLHLRCDKEFMMHLMESPMSLDQQIWNETTASFELTATVSDTQDLRWWLTAQGQHLDILAPDYLRATIIETMEEALGRQRSLR